MEALEQRSLLDGSLAGAVSVGELTGKRAYSGALEAAGEDLRRFTLTASATLSASLASSASPAAQLQLIQDLDVSGTIDDGETLASTPGAAASESFKVTLAPGTYYARVLAGAGATNYDLTLTADCAGGGMDTSRSLGAVSAPQTLRDYVGPADHGDYYKFSLGAAASLRVVLSQSASGVDADLRLIRDADKDGVVDAKETMLISSHPGTMSESFTKSLVKGTYYIKVGSVSGEVNYTLTLSADAAGGTLPTAANAGTLNSRAVITEFVGSADRDDIWRFTVPAMGGFTATLTDLQTDADLSLIRDRDADGVIDVGEVLGSSVNSSNKAEKVQTSLLPGTYFARVHRVSGDTTYRLTLLADPAGNIPAAARDLGTISKSLTAGDFIGTADTEDFYRFTLAARTTLTAKLFRMSADADLQLFRDANNNGAIDDGETLAVSAQDGVLDEVITMSLAKGVYYLRVFDPQGDTDYRLGVGPATT
jgi:hypothetical protein